VAKTIAIGVGMRNDGLASQGVLSLKTLWAELFIIWKAFRNFVNVFHQRHSFLLRNQFSVVLYHSGLVLTLTLTLTTNH